MLRTLNTSRCNPCADKYCCRGTLYAIAASQRFSYPNPTTNRGILLSICVPPTTPWTKNSPGFPTRKRQWYRPAVYPFSPLQAGGSGVPRHQQPPVRTGSGFAELARVSSLKTGQNATGRYLDQFFSLLYLCLAYFTTLMGDDPRSPSTSIFTLLSLRQSINSRK